MDRVDKPKDVERVLCFDAKTGKKLWEHAYPCVYSGVSYPSGPRASVTIHDGRAYSLGTMGHFASLDAAKNFVLRAGARSNVQPDITANPAEIRGRRGDREAGRHEKKKGRCESDAAEAGAEETQTKLQALEARLEIELAPRNSSESVVYILPEDFANGEATHREANSLLGLKHLEKFLIESADRFIVDA